MKNSKRKRDVFKNIILSSMVISFCLLAITGIIKFRNILKHVNFPYDDMPMKEISTLHDWNGLLFLILVVVHLFIQRGWFVYLYKKILMKNNLLWKIILGSVVFLVIFFVTKSILPVPGEPENITRLKKKEVREYKGEDLSSIADFQENSINGTQVIKEEDYQLEVSGLVDKTLNLKYDQVLDRDKYSKVVEIDCVEGWSATILWEGILLKDLFEQAEIQDEANTVIFYAKDGYSSSLSLDYVLDNDIMLAYKMNDVILPPERGFPFQVIAEDKWGYKWVKWVTKIEISNDPDYKGYWERAGYNNNGDADGPKFE